MSITTLIRFRIRFLSRTLGAAALLGLAGAAWAEGGPRYEVTIVNLTKGQTFTPQLIATHSRQVSAFTLGDPASLGLEILAEGGDTSMLAAELSTSPHAIGDLQTLPDLLGPGERVSVEVSASARHRYLTVAAMLIPTNDTFVALNGVPLPKRYTSVTALAYDAGTEQNDQNCLNIPGPRCGGEGHSPGPNDGDEGFVYVSNGFHELPAAESGEVLGPLTYDWRNPIARVVVRRVH